MPLSGDQRALLNLLLVRGKSPDEIAGTLGVDRAAVETRVEAALAALAPEGPSIPPAVALQLVGRADPISRADAASAIAADPELAERVEKVRAGLESEFAEAGAIVGQRETSPTETKGPPPAKQAEAGAAADAARAESPEPESRALEEGGKRTTGTFDLRNRRLLSILVSAAGLILVVAAVLVLFGGGDGETPVEGGPTEARLTPVEGQSGRGTVEFGFAGTSFAANVAFSGLDRNRAGESYALWLNGPVGAFPVERVKVGRNGSVAGQAVLNEAIICFIAADLFTDLRLARSGDDEFRAALRQAVRSDGSGPFPDYVGKTVLTGRITMPADTRETLVRECGGRTPGSDNQGS
jgi:hypothetical protein